MKQVFAWLVTAGVLCYCEASQAQPTNIVSAEYFIDSDPGYGNGTSISIGTPGPVLSAISFNAGVGALTNGMHTLFVRSKNAGGSWSQTNKMFFVKVQGLSGNTSTVTNIDKLEYFFDNDPGEGNGVNVPVSASTNIGAFVFNADVSSLSTGVHTIYVRSRDAEGKWSVVSKHFFGVYQPLVGNNNTVVNIT